MTAAPFLIAIALVLALALWRKPKEQPCAYEHRIIANRDSNVIPFRKRRPF